METAVHENDVSCSGFETGPSFLVHASRRGEASVRKRAAIQDDADEIV